MRVNLTKSRSRLYFVFVACLLLPFVLPFPYVRGLNNPNELVRVYTVIALVENGSYRIDEQVDFFGWSEDLARVRAVDGSEHYAMVKAPGVLYAGVPPYAVFSKIVAPLVLHERYPVHLTGLDEERLEVKRLDWLRRSTWVMRFFALQLPCFLFLVWFERYLRAYSNDPLLRYATVLAAGLGTNFVAYSHMFASHSLFAIAGFVAFALAARALASEGGSVGRDAVRTQQGRESIVRAAACGFLTGLCVALEYQAFFFAVALSIFALGVHVSQRRITSAMAFVVGGAIHVPHVMWFQSCAYGNPFTPGHKQIENARFAAEHRTGLWGISWPTWSATKALLVDPNFGFLGLSPFMWLGLAAVPLVLLARGRRVVMLAWLACMVSVIGVNAGFVEWRAGWTVGPRYLVVCAPFFAFAALLALENVARRGGPRRRELAQGVAAGLALSGIVSVGLVSILVDTLPDTMGRPFAQFFIPMMRRGLVPHDLGEALGLRPGVMFIIAAGSMVLAIPLLWGVSTRRPRRLAAAAAAVAFFVGAARAFTPPDDGSALYELHPSTTGFATRWEPAPASAQQLRETPDRPLAPKVE